MLRESVVVCSKFACTPDGAAPVLHILLLCIAEVRIRLQTTINNKPCVQCNSSSLDLQAMDRAHRLGQKRVVTVYRLLMRDTLEERIMSLQQFKKDVAGAVVNTDNVATATMDTSGVMDLMAGSAHQQT